MVQSPSLMWIYATLKIFNMYPVQSPGVEKTEKQQVLKVVYLALFVNSLNEQILNICIRKNKNSKQYEVLLTNKRNKVNTYFTQGWTGAICKL